MPFAGFFSNNPIVAWGLAILAILGIIRGKEELDEARGRAQQREASRKRARRVQIRLQEENNEKRTPNYSCPC